MSTKDEEMLQRHVNSIAKTLTDGFQDDDLNDDDEQMNAYDYLNDALDIRWTLNSDFTYRSASVLVAFGGPNIWVNTETNTVEGYWWGDKAFASFDDNIGLDDALEELFNCR